MLLHSLILEILWSVLLSAEDLIVSISSTKNIKHGKLYICVHHVKLITNLVTCYCAVESTIIY